MVFFILLISMEKSSLVCNRLMLDNTEFIKLADKEDIVSIMT